MSLRTRVFIGLLLIFAAGVSWMVYRMALDIDPRYRESAEESLVETSHLLASLIEQDIVDGEIDTPRLEKLFRTLYSRPFEAQIFSVHKTRVELRAYVTDHRGYVLFNTTGRDLGADYSEWHDVRQTLRGQYGARTTRDVQADPNSAVMYVSAPLLYQGRLAGVVSVGKPVQSFGQFVEAARENTLRVGLLAASSALALAIMVSLWLIRPFGFVTDYWRWVRQQRTLNPWRLARRAWDQMRGVSGEIRDALAGRNYVADYVQNLNHEVKSPLSAIRGAAELLQEQVAEPMPEAQRQLFLSNILRETHRIQETVDRMTELTALQTQRMLRTVQPVPLATLLSEVATAARSTAATRHITIRCVTNSTPEVAGDAFLLRRALANLVDNAIDFSPEAGEVTLALSTRGRHAVVTIADQGPGIPDYAQDKVFERFYSLARPGGRQKSTGLGLPFVREILSQHHGEVSLHNARGSGAVATLLLPLANT